MSFLCFKRLRVSLAVVLTLLLANDLSCVSKQKVDGSAKSTNKSQSAPATSPKQTVDGTLQQGVCPPGTRLNDRPRVCVTRGGFALGPFPLELQELCREKSPNEAATCVQKQDWPFELLMSLYPDYVNECPPGTAPGTGGVCIGTDSLFGPFTMEQVMACRAGVPLVQQSQCDELAWPPMFMKFVQKDSSPPGIEVDNGVSVIELNSRADSQDPIASESENKAPPSSENLTGAGSSNAVVGQETDQTNSALQNSTSVRGSTQKERSEKRSAVSASIPQAPRPPTFCVHSWDEVPGTADFTTVNVYLRSLREPQLYQLDRSQDATLLGSRDFQNLDVCGRARFLKGCFQKVVYDNHSVAAQAFRKWALGRLRPVEAYMAIVHQKSRLGLWRDECWRGQCKGRGLARVDAAYTVSGKKIRNEDVVWVGVTHNIITNLRFGMRQIARKLNAGPSDLYQLGFSMYQTPGFRERFARDVTENYRKLVSCQLE